MFKITATDGSARAGVLHTAHGRLKTPFYMPVATKGAPKDITPRELEENGIRCIICNGFLLGLKPGGEIVANHGGIHSYMQWNKGVFTDSGGFQILSDEFLVKKTPEGIIFRNPYTGEAKLFEPKDSIHWQHRIGSDVAMALDDVPRYGVTKTEVRAALKRSHDWLKKNIMAHQCEDDKTNPKQMLFGIGQGGIYRDLRETSAQLLLEADVDGYAMGGLAIGEPPAKMFHAIEIQARIFEQDPEKPRYVMGLGSPVDMLEAIALGVDIFDSIFPTQNGRRGTLFTRDGPLRISNAKYRHDISPIDPDSTCELSRTYTRSYLHHMMRLHERIGWKIASIHNVHFIQALLDEAREHIRKGTLREFIDAFTTRYVA